MVAFIGEEMEDVFNELEASNPQWFELLGDSPTTHLPVSGQFGEIMVGDFPWIASGGFTDILGKSAAVVHPQPKAAPPKATAVKRVVAQARNERPAPPTMRVVSANEDFHNPIGLPEHVADVVVFGDDEAGNPLFPVTAKLYESFAVGADDRAPRYIRLDTDASYKDFRTENSPVMAMLKAKVEELEALVRGHMADDTVHVHGIATDISRLQAAGDGMTRVPLMLPPAAEGAVDCWRDGDVICCSMWLPGPDGDVRVCTTATPLAEHVADVADYTRRSGVEPADVLGFLPTMACMLGGGSLLPKMAAAASSLLARPEAATGEPFVGRMVPANQPTLATLIALLQLCQRGEAQACTEWSRLATLAASVPELAAAMADAKARLRSAQRGAQ